MSTEIRQQFLPCFLLFQQKDIGIYRKPGGFGMFHSRLLFRHDPGDLREDERAEQALQQARRDSATYGSAMQQSVAKFAPKQQEAFEAAAAELRNVDRCRAPRDAGKYGRRRGGLVVCVLFFLMFGRCQNRNKVEKKSAFAFPLHGQ